MNVKLTMHSRSQLCIQSAQQPGWLGMPGAVAYSGLGRRTLYNAINDGRIKSVCVRLKGSGRGRRLINLQSLEEFISSFAGV